MVMSSNIDWPNQAVGFLIAVFLAFAVWFITQKIAKYKAKEKATRSLERLCTMRGSGYDAETDRIESLMIHDFIDDGADTTPKKTEGERKNLALCLIHNRSPKKLRALLERDPSLVENLKDDAVDGNNVLHYIAKNLYYEPLIDGNDKNGIFYTTYEIIKLLAGDFDIDITKENAVGETPLSLALQVNSNTAEMILLFLMKKKKYDDKKIKKLLDKKYKNKSLLGAVLRVYGGQKFFMRPITHDLEKQIRKTDQERNEHIQRTLKLLLNCDIDIEQPLYDDRLLKDHIVEEMARFPDGGFDEIYDRIEEIENKKKTENDIKTD